MADTLRLISTLGFITGLFALMIAFVGLIAGLPQVVMLFGGLALGLIAQRFLIRDARA